METISPALSEKDKAYRGLSRMMGDYSERKIAKTGNEKVKRVE